MTLALGLEYMNESRNPFSSGGISNHLPQLLGILSKIPTLIRDAYQGWVGHPKSDTQNPVFFPTRNPIRRKFLKPDPKSDPAFFSTRPIPDAYMGVL
ncbi:unnamed protein product [Meloidogyne enterolobii]|uniref:Uncharacterized protein n=2 Tax=Meloidogyne enterolobii TaxID=390850 RepID=A0A6V7XD51_MELEN|nr:unnamed protein product [Meloidogyne enterolobii]